MPTIFALLAVVELVPRRFRLRFWLIRDARWLVPELRCLAFPVAVSRKRFLVPLCVFCLGIGLFARHEKEVNPRRHLAEARPEGGVSAVVSIHRNPVL